VPLSAPEPLAAHHKLDLFDCSESSLDAWLKDRALANQFSGASRTFVTCEGDRVVVRVPALVGVREDQLRGLLSGRLLGVGDHQRGEPSRDPIELESRLLVGHLEPDGSLGADAGERQRLAGFAPSLRRVVPRRPEPSRAGVVTVPWGAVGDIHDLHPRQACEQRARAEDVVVRVGDHQQHGSLIGDRAGQCFLDLDGALHGSADKAVFVRAPVGGRRSATHRRRQRWDAH